jgi:hypothetical protein
MHIYGYSGGDEKQEVEYESVDLGERLTVEIKMYVIPSTEMK